MVQGLHSPLWIKPTFRFCPARELVLTVHLLTCLGPSEGRCRGPGLVLELRPSSERFRMRARRASRQWRGWGVEEVWVQGPEAKIEWYPRKCLGQSEGLEGAVEEGPGAGAQTAPLGPRFLQSWTLPRGRAAIACLCSHDLLAGAHVSGSTLSRDVAS